MIGKDVYLSALLTGGGDRGGERPGEAELAEVSLCMRYLATAPERQGMARWLDELMARRTDAMDGEEYQTWFLALFSLYGLPRENMSEFSERLRNASDSMEASPREVLLLPAMVRLSQLYEENATEGQTLSGWAYDIAEKAREGKEPDALRREVVMILAYIGGRRWGESIPMWSERLAGESAAE